MWSVCVAEDGSVAIDCTGFFFLAVAFIHPKR